MVARPPSLGSMDVSRTQTSPRENPIRSVAPSVPLLVTTALAIYLLVTLWRVAIGEPWLFPFQGLWGPASPVFAALAAVAVIAITAFVYRWLAAAQSSPRGGIGAAGVEGQNVGVPVAVLASSTTNALAVASLITGLVGIGPVAVILGHVANSQIKRTDERGSGVAAVGLVLGYLELVFLLVVFLIQRPL